MWFDVNGLACNDDAALASEADGCFQSVSLGGKVGAKGSDAEVRDQWSWHVAASKMGIICGRGTT